MTKSDSIYYNHEYESELFNEVCDEYIDDVNDFSPGQYKELAKKLITDIICISREKSITAKELSSRLLKALTLISDLEFALNYMDKNYDSGEDNKLYIDFNWNRDDVLKPWKQDQTRRVDIQELNKVIAKYLSYEWISSPIFEWYLINGYLKYCIRINRDSLINSTSLSKIYATKTSVNAFSYYSKMLIGKIIGFIFSYALPIYLIALSANHKYIITSVIIAVASFYWVPFAIVRFPFAIFYGYKSRKSLLKLIRLKTITSMKSWSPIEILEKAREMNETYMMPELLALLGKIYKRNRHVFNVNQ